MSSVPSLPWVLNLDNVVALHNNCTKCPVFSEKQLKLKGGHEKPSFSKIGFDLNVLFVYMMNCNFLWPFTQVRGKYSISFRSQFKQMKIKN